MLHAAAWTDVDGAEADPDGARLVNVDGTRNVAALGVPVVSYSTDYVFDGLKREPYVESDGRIRSRSTAGRSSTASAKYATAGSFAARGFSAGRGANFVKTMLELGRERDEVSVVADQVGSPTYVGHLAEATRELLELPQGTWHLAAEGECSWAEFARAIFEEAGLDTNVREITTEELGRPAPRPAYSVLAKREGRAGPTALARRPSRVPRAPC